MKAVSVSTKSLRRVQHLEQELRAIKRDLIRLLAEKPISGGEAALPLKGFLRGVRIEAEDVEAAKRSLFGEAR